MGGVSAGIDADLSPEGIRGRGRTTQQIVLRVVPKEG